MFQFVLLSIGLLIGLGAIFATTRRKEIIANWKKYRMNPIFIFSAFLFKPDTDTRSRLDFAFDNLKEVIDSLVTGLFEVVLTPIFKIFRLVSQSIEQTLSGFLGMRAIFGNMWRSLMDIVSVFMNRFTLIFHELQMVMFKLLTSFQRISGVATSAIFAGLSSLYAMMNFIDLVIKVIIIILIIIVVIIIFLFFILAPFIPTILVVIGIIASTALAAGVGGMAGTFCFGESTPIEKQTGEYIPISNIRLGDTLKDGGKVTAVMKFLAPKDGMYDIAGSNIQVSGSHIIYTDEGARLVKDYALATPVPYEGEYVYCLTTTTHKIQIGKWVFSDWEEISESERDQSDWNQFVFETLNTCSGQVWSPPNTVFLQSESCVTSQTRIQTPSGSVYANEICPGMMVLDDKGQATKVTGVVYLDKSQVHFMTPERISVGAWRWDSTLKLWKQTMENAIPYSQVDLTEQLISLTTEAGTFMTESGTALRDFTDVGADNIQMSYEWIISRLTASFFGGH